VGILNLFVKLLDGALTQIESLYKAGPNTTKGQHFGSRIVFDKEGFLYFSAGERGNHFVNPQDITRDNGKIYRLNDDGVFQRQPVCRPRKRKGSLYLWE
jgi:glucose/arabinose dehydrogenase